MELPSGLQVPPKKFSEMEQMVDAGPPYTDTFFSSHSGNVWNATESLFGDQKGLIATLAVSIFRGVRRSRSQIHNLLLKPAPVV